MAITNQNGTTASSRRRSQRLSTGKTSTYFDDDISDSDESQQRPKKVAKKTGNKASSGLNGKGRRPSSQAAGRSRTAAQASDDDDFQDRDDEESRVTFIPLPKLRDEGGIDYEPERIHPNTLLFLKDLKANNKRSWLKLHDQEYRRSLKDWESFVETITEKITEVDETVPELPLKDVIFRIYRDVRFSKDPTPYKPHYSAAWSRTGRKGPYACYYIHVEPQACFVGGGLWCPDKDALARLRASVDERPHRIRRALTNPAFRDTFLPKAAEFERAQQQKKGKQTPKGKGKAAGDSSGEVDEAAAAVRAFAEANKDSALKTKPKGFDADHRDIELLKLKNYTVGKKFADRDLTAPDAQDKIMAAVRALVGFVTFINSVVMPDPGDDSDSEEEEVQDEDEQEDEE
ncbi:hypothetical protein Micbo1qcDRAFT_136870 [Microdochium bolleyi]|uniref:DUF2461 domain-containing protein n=1 Tax=Microdochium bolleyi TaxID=196109 RepID=A0A136IXQ7_9PEZI|nr:hypothetical protein Micbo1qcDRAFT_136870 [Microdochium bolleyi]